MYEKHQLVLDFIRAYIKLHGVAPSYTVIAKGIGLRSKANVHRIVHRLKDEGHLTLRPHKFNSIAVRDQSVRAVGRL
jgi:SOS-response transcriptional repressor LexA